MAFHRARASNRSLMDTRPSGWELSTWEACPSPAPKYAVRGQDRASAATVRTLRHCPALRGNP